MRAGVIGIGELSKRTGVNTETIRYYERCGVMPKPPRTEGGHRAYDEEFVKRLAFVSRSRQLGFSLDEIRSLLELVDGNDFTCADVRTLTLKHAAEARQKIADLRKLERTLKGMAAQCHGNKVPDCPIVDALFVGEWSFARLQLVLRRDGAQAADIGWTLKADLVGLLAVCPKNYSFRNIDLRLVTFWISCVP